MAAAARRGLRTRQSITRCGLRTRQSIAQMGQLTHSTSCGYPVWSQDPPINHQVWSTDPPINRHDVQISTPKNHLRAPLYPISSQQTFASEAESERTRQPTSRQIKKEKMKHGNHATPNEETQYNPKPMQKQGKRHRKQRDRTIRGKRRKHIQIQEGTPKTTCRGANNNTEETGRKRNEPGTEN